MNFEVEISYKVNLDIRHIMRIMSWMIKEEKNVRYAIVQKKSMTLYSKAK